MKFWHLILLFTKCNPLWFMCFKDVLQICIVIKWHWAQQAAFFSPCNKSVIGCSEGKPGICQDAVMAEPQVQFQLETFFECTSPDGKQSETMMETWFHTWRWIRALCYRSVPVRTVTVWSVCRTVISGLVWFCQWTLWWSRADTLMIISVSCVHCSGNPAAFKASL